MIMEPELLKAVTQSLEDYFGVEVTISDVKLLSEPDRRNRIVRLFLSMDNTTIQSYSSNNHSLIRAKKLRMMIFWRDLPEILQGLNS